MREAIVCKPSKLWIKIESRHLALHSLNVKLVKDSEGKCSGWTRQCCREELQIKELYVTRSSCWTFAPANTSLINSTAIHKNHRCFCGLKSIWSIQVFFSHFIVLFIRLNFHIFNFLPSFWYFMLWARSTIITQMYIHPQVSKICMTENLPVQCCILWKGLCWWTPTQQVLQLTKSTIKTSIKS